MNDLTHIKPKNLLMTQQKYQQRYKQLLSKETLTKADVKQFNEVIEHYKIVYPDWKETQRM